MHRSTVDIWCCFGLLLTLVCCLLHAAEARVSSHTLRQDSRSAWVISSFGYNNGGVLELNLSNLKVDYSNNPKFQEKYGFVLKTVSSATSSLLEEDTYSSDLKKQCFLEHLPKDDTTSTVINYMFLQVPEGPGVVASNDTTFRYVVTKPGLYALFYFNCVEDTKVTFDLSILQYNLDRNNNRDYLTRGESPLPTVYGVMGFAFLAIMIVWIVLIIRERKEKVVFKIHYLMAVLVFSKTLTLFVEAIRYHYLKQNGVTITWTTFYYLVTIPRGIILFVTLLLLGAGWSFLKPFLSDTEKKALLTILPLQVFANIAMIIMETQDEGSRKFQLWTNICIVIDICCFLLILPILSYSIRNLRAVENTDGKAARNAARLRQFRQFYIFIMLYVYTTGVLLTILKSAMPDNYFWVASLLGELCTLAFFSWIGYRFRPVKNNEYLSVPGDEEDELRTVRSITDEELS